MQWIPMRHEADCWVPACAMAADVSHEETEKAFVSPARTILRKFSVKRTTIRSSDVEPICSSFF